MEQMAGFCRVPGLAPGPEGISDLGGLASQHRQ